MQGKPCTYAFPGALLPGSDINTIYILFNTKISEQDVCFWRGGCKKQTNKQTQIEENTNKMKVCCAVAVS